MTGPLHGVNVLDFGQAGVGPWAGSLLGFLGANVVKVERPEGDIMRNQAPRQRGLAVAYTAWNTAKKAITLNLKSEAGRGLLAPLLEEADVLCENLRPGVMERLGLDFRGATKINPQIVYASSPGWGASGPMADWPCVDVDAQAFCGFASVTGDEGGKAEIARHAYHLDLNASCCLASSIVLGLLQRDRTRSGVRVMSSHLASTMSHFSTRSAEYLMASEIPGPLGSASASTAPHQAFLCRDKAWLCVGVEQESQWRAFCEAIARPDLLDDLRFARNIDRVRNRGELAGLLAGVFAGRPARWWYVRLTDRGVPAGYLRDYEDLRLHQQVLANEYIVELDHPHQGKVALGGVPWHFSRTPAQISRAPAPGEHTDELLNGGFRCFGSGDLGPPVHAQPGDAGQPPLAAIRVIDASQGIAGPYAAVLLADAGAEVIKVELPAGDYARGFAPATPTGDSAVFHVLNRNKRGVTLDLEVEHDREAFRRLVQEADVVIEDWGTGAADARGLDYAAITAANPRLVWCAVSAFGETGPYSHLAGSELIYQGMSDYCFSLGELGQAPVRWGTDVAGTSAGSMSFLGILAALFERNRSGMGQRLCVSPWGTLLCMRQATWSVLGDIDEWEGPFLDAYVSPRMHGWRTQDGPAYFRLHNATEAEYVAFLVDMGMEEYLDDPRFGNAGRDVVGLGRYSMEVMPIWDQYMANKTLQEVVAIARRHNAQMIPINTLKAAVEHPQTMSQEIVQEFHHPLLGPRRAIASPCRGPWRYPPPLPAPALGEHNDQILVHWSSA